MSQPILIAISKYKIDDYYTWSYNVTHTGLTNQVKTTGTFYEQITQLIEEIYTNEQYEAKQQLILINTQINKKMSVKLTEKYSHINFFLANTTYSKIQLRKIFSNEYLTQNHIKLLYSKNYYHSKTLFIATDSGKDFSKEEEVCYGWFYKIGQTPFYKIQKSLINDNHYGELQAILTAVKDNYKNSNYKNIVIQSDSMTAMKAITIAVKQNRIPNNMNHPIIIELFNEYKKAIKNTNIKLEHVPAHKRYEPNEVIDSLIRCYQQKIELEPLAQLLSGVFYNKKEIKTNKIKKYFQPQLLINTGKNGQIKTFLDKK